MKLQEIMAELMSGKVFGPYLAHLGVLKFQKRGALNREAAAGLISAIGPCEGGRVFQALLAANEAEFEKTKLPDCLVKEAEPEPTSYTTARTSKHSDVWMDAMRSEFNGLEAAGTFVEVSELPAIFSRKWLTHSAYETSGSRGVSTKSRYPTLPE